MKPLPLTLLQLRWLIASLALVYGLLALHLPGWVSLMAALAGGWRYAVTLGRASMPRLRMLIPLAGLTVAGIAFSHGGLFGRDASVSLLAAMMALKLLESHTTRDAMLLVFLAFFLSITSFLFSQSIVTGLYLVIPLIALVGTLIAVNHPNGGLPVRATFRLSAMMLLQAAPIMLILFLLFPRIQGPLWGVPQDAYSGMTGLSDQMSPGTISQLSRSDSPAFRVAFKGTTPDPAQLYWRGPVFWHFDGTTWSIGEASHALTLESTGEESPPIDYTVTLEPHNRRWLFMLDLPAIVPPEARLTHDRQLLAHQPVRMRMRYAGRSSLRYQLGTALQAEARTLALQLPTGINPRSRKIAASWKGESPDRIVERALAWYRDNPFRYTLTPPLLGQHAIDEFLFVTRSGFCEHYAGSFVFLMRSAGVPARVVTGYQGGEINPTDGYLIVRQADAHAWAEVWLEGRGWVRVDPTAAVAPQRVESGVATALPAGEPVPPLMRADMRWLRQLYLRWDAVNNRWNQWVLGYDHERQMALISRIKGSAATWEDLIQGLLISVGTAILLISAMLLLRMQPRDPLTRAYARFQRRLSRIGMQRLPHEGPLDFGARAAARCPQQAETIREITVHYAQLRYGAEAKPEAVAALTQRIRNFRP